MKHNPQYPSTVLTNNLRPTARTISEATRDARYACAVQTFRSDSKLLANFIVEAFIGFVCIVSMTLPFVAGFYVWLGVGK